jgi:hypothetical protein
MLFSIFYGHVFLMRKTRTAASAARVLKGTIMNQQPRRGALVVLSVVLVWVTVCAAWRGEPRRLPGVPVAPSAPYGHLDEDSLLYWDNGVPRWFFSFPAPGGEDSLYNVRFQAPDTCRIWGAWFMLYLGQDTAGATDTLYTAPYFAPLVWSSDSNYFPDEVLGGDTIAWDSIDAFYPDWWFADLSNLDIHLDAGQWFHVGFTGILEEPSDTIAIISDNGDPGTPYSGFMWRGEWDTFLNSWGVGYNLFIATVVTIGTSDVQVLKPAGVPSTFSLDPPYPNPFNPTATLRFTIAEAGPVQLTIRDILGRTVATLAQGRITPGVYSVTVDGSTWASGVYFADLAQGGNRQVVRLVLMK